MAAQTPSSRRRILARKSTERAYRLDWANLRLLVEQKPDFWRIGVYDSRQHRTLFQGVRSSAHGAKTAVVEFALTHLYGPGHEFNSERLSTVVPWSVAWD